MRIYCPNAETELHTDASSQGYGAILLQRDSEERLFRPIYYANGKTTESEAKFHSYELDYNDCKSVEKIPNLFDRYIV